MTRSYRANNTLVNRNSATSWETHTMANFVNLWDFRRDPDDTRSRAVGFLGSNEGAIGISCLHRSEAHLIFAERRPTKVGGKHCATLEEEVYSVLSRSAQPGTNVVDKGDEVAVDKDEK